MKTVLSAREILSVFFFCLLAFGHAAAIAQTSNTCISPLNADFVTKYELLEAVGYVQTNAFGPVLNGAKPYGFEAIIKLATNLDGTATVAALTLPNGQPILMTNQGTSEFYLLEVTNAFTNITSSYPNGTYQFTIFNNTVSVTLPDDAALPNAPTLSNYAADQTLDAGKDFNLSWEPFITGGVVDFIILNIVSDTNGATVFNTASAGCPGALDGKETSVLIPANTLASNTTYHVGIEFVKVYTYDTNSVPRSALLAAMETSTMTKISTQAPSATGSPPILANTALVGGGAVRFDVETTPGLNYAVQFNPDLADSTGWTSLFTSNASGSVLSITNSPPSGNADGFYRVVQQ